LGVEARLGDFDKPESLASAYAGLDRLLIIPSNDMTPGKRATQHTAAVSAAALAGVPHIVFVSSCGTRAGDPMSLRESYFAPEQKLMRVARQWTILRMAFFAESFADESRMILPGGTHAALSATPVNFVSREDVAAAAAGLLTTEGHYGAIYHATGPAALGGEERAAAIAKASGKPMSFVKMPLEPYRQGLAALPPAIVEAVLEIQDLWATGAFDITTGDVERLSGKRPRSLTEVLTGLLS
jgi:NAD(P)H dehydrogenase (quinone)